MAIQFQTNLYVKSMTNISHTFNIHMQREIRCKRKRMRQMKSNPHFQILNK
jgi:hypothetical protein